MVINTFLAEVNDNFRGNEDVTPTLGTEDWDYWLRVANRIRRNLYSDTTKQWVSTYQVLNLGLITVNAAPSFDLPDGFLNPAEGCYVIDASGSRHEFPIIHAQDQNSELNVQSVFVAGADPQKLYFSKAITIADGYVGGTLYLPAYVMPDDMVGVTGEEPVVVDDPDWLAMATASELAFNDITYESKAPDLNAKATSMYKAMVDRNRRGTSTNPRKSAYNVTRIGQRHGVRFS